METTTKYCPRHQKLFNDPTFCWTIFLISNSDCFIVLSSRLHKNIRNPRSRFNFVWSHIKRLDRRLEKVVWDWSAVVYSCPYLNMDCWSLMKRFCCWSGIGRLWCTCAHALTINMVAFVVFLLFLFCFFVVIWDWSVVVHACPHLNDWHGSFVCCFCFCFFVVIGDWSAVVHPRPHL